MILPLVVPAALLGLSIFLGSWIAVAVSIVLLFGAVILVAAIRDMGQYVWDHDLDD